jgi:DNA polymerase I-like protein with 3'-5' exonuclease and polymerase domains
MEQHPPKAILALGGVALKTLTGLVGKGLNIHMLRGYALDDQVSIAPRYPGVPVIATYHPSFLRRGSKGRNQETGAKTDGGAGKGGMHLLGVMIRDIKFAMQVAEGGWSYERPVYQTHPSLDEARAFLYRVRDNQNLLLAYDIETDVSADLDEEELDDTSHHITQVQFSLREKEGICFPWTPDFIEIAKEVFATENPKVAHNGFKFDNPRLRAAGMNLRGRLDDTMEMFRRAQPDLPSGLQYVSSFYGFPFPWKHMSASHPEFYGCADVDSPQWIMAQLPADMKAAGIWRSYDRHVHDLGFVLTNMSNRGIPVDEDRRTEFKAELQERIGVIESEMQAMVPDHLRNFHPKDDKKGPGGYKKDPKDAVLDGPTTHGGEPAKWTKKSFLVDGAEVERWVKLLPFNPSSQQLIRYMKWKGHEVPQNYKTQRDTTAHKELERLAKRTKDPLYEQVIEQREVGIMMNTFVEAWAPRADGRVHSEYYTQSTGQLSSRRPNAQNSPNPGYGSANKMKLAKSFRRMIRARQGRKLIELDWKSAHALTLGFEAQDPDYIRIARIDMHSFFAASSLLRIEKADKLLAMPDGELKVYLKSLRKSDKLYQGTTFENTRSKRAKATILGYGFGMGARTLFMQNPESFKNLLEAQRSIDGLNALFPRTAKFRDNIRMQAHNSGRLISRYGYIRWFWSVYEWDSKSGRWAPSDDSEAAIAFLPANDAHGHLKDCMLRMEELGWNEKYGLINQIHDALIFECPDEYVEECIWNVKNLLQEPSQLLVDPVVAPEGLWIEAEVKMGQDWSVMEEIKAVDPALPKAA